MIKQVIVIRKDLNMRKGKMAAQAAHASMKIFFDRFTECFEKDSSSNKTDFIGIFIPLTDIEKEWVEGSFIKICLSCSSEEELLNLLKEAEESEIPCCLIEDNGYTEFHGIPTKTCIAIGPDEGEKIDRITGLLPLL